MHYIINTYTYIINIYSTKQYILFRKGCNANNKYYKADFESYFTLTFKLSYSYSKTKI